VLKENKMEEKNTEEIEKKELNYELEDDSTEEKVEVVDDTPEQDRGKKHAGDVDIPEEEITQYSSNVQKRINQLKRAYHDERREKERFLREQQEAVNYAKSLADQNSQLQDRLQKGETVLVESQKDRVSAKINEAEKEYKDAYESGDSEKMVKAQKSIARYTMEEREVENYKPVYQKPLQQPQNNVQQEIVPDDRTREWADQNRWFNTDAVMRGAAFGIHDELVAKGFKAGSEEYFERIDARIREEFPNKFGNKKPANVVAPASRSTGSSKVKLTKTQVSIAKRLGVPIEKYAEHVMKEQANG
tara:strand:- start:1631 stop:2539 length:909 start_codon:yes stop_codon:yes gene_type:complete